MRENVGLYAAVLSFFNLPDCRASPAKSISQVGRQTFRQCLPNFYSGEKCEIWPRFRPQSPRTILQIVFLAVLSVFVVFFVFITVSFYFSLT